MPSVNSSSRPIVGASSTVMTPSLPTLSNASAMISPIFGSCAEMVATLAISLRSSTSRADFSSVSDDRRGGGVDAALERDRVGAGRDTAQALVDHGLGQHGRGRGAVTGDVVGLGRDLLGELRAEVLVRVLELDLAGDGHAVVGDGGGAPLLVDDDVAALGAERHLDGVGEAVHAALERPPGVLVESRLLAMWIPQCLYVGLGMLGRSHATAPDRNAARRITSASGEPSRGGADRQAPGQARSSGAGGPRA